MRLLLLLSLYLFGCGVAFPDPGIANSSCVSTCGAVLFGCDDCAGFQDAEDRAVAEFEPVFGPGVCASLKDFHVSARHEPEGWWIDRLGRKVGGLSGCDQVSYVVGPPQNGWAEVLDDWHQLSYFHEVAHHQECPVENVNHEGWEEQIYPAISRASLRRGTAR